MTKNFKPFDRKAINNARNMLDAKMESNSITATERAELEMYRRQRTTAIENYHEFGKAPVGSPERMAAYVSQLSPWNLHRGAEALREWREEAKREAYREVQGTLLADDKVISSSLGEDALQGYMDGYRMAYKEVNETCDNLIHQGKRSTG